MHATHASLLSPSEKELYLYMEGNGGRLRNTADAVKDLRKPRITVQRNIQSLVRKGAARRIGPNKTGHWELVF